MLARARGFKPIYELRLFYRALRNVRDNPLYLYARVTQKRRAQTRSRWGSCFGAAVRVIVLGILGALAIPFVMDGSFRAYSYIYHNGMRGVPDIIGLIVMVVFSFVGAAVMNYYITGIYRCMHTALGLLASGHKTQPILHLSEDLAATQLTGHDLLAAAVRLIAGPLIKRVVIVTGVLIGGSYLYHTWIKLRANYAYSQNYSGGGPDWELANEIIRALSAVANWALAVIPATLASLLIVLFCVVVGYGIRRRTGSTTLAAVLTMLNLVWVGIALLLFIDGGGPWGELFSIHEAQVAVGFIAPQALLLIALGYLALLLAVQRLGVLRVLAYMIPLSGVGGVAFLILQEVFWWDFWSQWLAYFTVGPFTWLSVACSPLNPLNSLIIYDTYRDSLRFDVVSLFVTPLIVLTQLIILAVLIRFARGLITYKEQGRT